MCNYCIFCIVLDLVLIWEQHCFLLSSADTYFAPVLFKVLTWGLLDSGHLFYNLKLFRINSPAVKNTCFYSVSVMKNDTDTGSMQKEAMSATEQVGRKKNDTEKDDTERKRKPDTSPLEGLLFNSESV